GIWRKKAQTNAEISPSNASPYRPPEKLPVASFITPTYQGPKKPPRLPIELIHAMAAAAAVPVRNIGGIAQNGPLEPENPTAAIDIPTSAHHVPIVMPAMTSPAVETMQANSRFQRRSFMRSETKPQTTRPMPPQMYGTMVNQPTVMLLVTPMDLIICGMKNSIPRLAVTMPR